MIFFQGKLLTLLSRFLGSYQLPLSMPNRFYKEMEGNEGSLPLHTKHTQELDQTHQSIPVKKFLSLTFFLTCNIKSLSGWGAKPHMLTDAE